MIRPVGSAVLGSHADARGRRNALSLSIVLMCVGSLVIAVLPTYAQLGLAAPILLLFARRDRRPDLRPAVLAPVVP